MKVLKFGGTSVGNPNIISDVIDIVGKEVAKNNSPFVVVSAFSGVTNTLVELSEAALLEKRREKRQKKLEDLRDWHIKTIEKLVNLKKQSETKGHVLVLFHDLEHILDGVALLKELSNKTRDKVLSFGERLSAFIIAEAFRTKGFASRYVDARDYILVSESLPDGKLLFEETQKKILPLQNISQREVCVATGFIARNISGETATLGRGGSDYSASIFATALQADSLEIWTDVDGVMSSNPKHVPRAFPLVQMTYREAIEMSHFGSKVIYSPTIVPLMMKKIPLYIKNTFYPKNKGTLIGDGPYPPEKSYIKGISSISEVALIRVQGGGLIGVAGIAHRIYETLYLENINIILITQSSSEHSITLAISPENAERAGKCLNKQFELELEAKRIEPIDIESGFSVIAVVGENMRDRPGVSGKVFGALGAFDISVVAIAQGSSKLNISVIVRKKEMLRALNAIHDTFFFPLEKIINVFLVGAGNIGETLIEQIAFRNKMKGENKIIKLISVATSKSYVTNEDGIPPEEVFEKLKKSEKKTNIDFFVNQVKNFKYPNKVFVDCTASEKVSNFYQDLLENKINIVAANKKANSREYEYYNAMRKASNRNGSLFLYETNVGAALPIIKTLQNLIHSGDKIESVEAVLSGSLSYILSGLHEGTPFSKVISDAMKNGFTEPNPKDDLDGMDFARKLIIIAREIGLKTEIEDVDMEYIIPEKLLAIENKDDFVKEISTLDTYFEEKITPLKKAGKKLCYIGKIVGDKVSLKLQEIEATHPFYMLKGTDNIITIKTNYYPNGKTVLGAGAGKSVTASGVLANIMEVI